MKKFLIIIFALTYSFGTFAQKAERDNIRKGNKEYRQEKYSMADARYKSALQVNPNSKEAIYNLANSSYKQGRWDEALTGYSKYITMEKVNPISLSKAFHNMGNVYLHKYPPNKGDTINYLDKAVESYKQSLRLNPNDEQTRYNLAVAQKLRSENGGGGGGKDQNKDKNNKDKNKNKDQNNKDKKDQDKNKDNKDQQKQDQKQMSPESAKQLLKAIEQDEKQTQDRVKQIKIEERKQKNEDNRRNNKDW